MEVVKEVASAGKFKLFRNFQNSGCVFQVERALKWNRFLLWILKLESNGRKDGTLIPTGGSLSCPWLTIIPIGNFLRGKIEENSLALIDFLD